GAGQSCTTRGLAVLSPAESAEPFLRAIGDALADSPAGTVVHAGIKTAYDAGLAERAGLPGVSMAARAAAHGAHPSTEAQPALLVTDAATFVARETLHAELYRPATAAVRCRTTAQLIDLARGLEGHLTATVHGTEADLGEHAELLQILARKVGRLVVNGFPTGVEVSPAMHHGGPYPATTDARATSVGTAAIRRFTRPICFQDVPEDFLPEELRGPNPRGIWRLLAGRFTKNPL